MDIKTLSTIIGHVSSTTTLNTYTHVTDAMRPVSYTHLVWDQVESHYQRDNCSTRNEFIEKAIRFYSGYLDAESADAYLPRVLADVLEGKLGALRCV